MSYQIATLGKQLLINMRNVTHIQIVKKELTIYFNSTFGNGSFIFFGHDPYTIKVDYETNEVAQGHFNKMTNIMNELK